jgi:hypothetical protein
MQEPLSYKKAKKLNAVFLLLLLASDQNETSQSSSQKGQDGSAQGPSSSSFDFDEKLEEFECNKYRF